MSTILIFAAVVVALGIGYAVGRARRGPTGERPDATTLPASSPTPAAVTTNVTSAPDPRVDERARIVRALEAETAALRRRLARSDAGVAGFASLAAERRGLFDALAAARAETARYRQIVVDLENNAPPPLLGSPGAPDDLKLIVGVGPVLERMLYQLGITSYRQIAHWTERDIDDVDSRLHEFPGRIRRDGWVTQARALHQSKYGEAPPPRGRA